VTWNIPAELYKRFQELRVHSAQVNFVGIPDSDQDFAVLMLDDAVTRGEAVLAAYEKHKDPKLIIDPFEAVRNRIQGVRHI
jgi:hypothetical protein